MLNGEYQTLAERLYIQGWVHLPRLSVQGTVRFLADTGTDRATLMPVDGLTIEVNYDQLEESSMYPTSGIGGLRDSFTEEAFVIFVDADEAVAYAYQIDLAIISPEESNQSIRSSKSIIISG